MEELKSCPFCAAEEDKLIVLGDVLFFVECKNCLADGPLADNREEAIELWNRRVSED